MNILQPIHYFLDEELVDEIWTTIKRDGINTETVKDAAIKAGAKAKFGLGHLWKWLAADLKVEASVDGELSISQTISHTSFLRAILLPELLSNTKKNHQLTIKNLEQLDSGTYFELKCNNCVIFPIPSLANFQRQNILAEALNHKGSSNLDTVIENSIFEIIEKSTSSNKAFALSEMLGQDIFKEIYDEVASEIYAAQVTSDDDQYMIFAQGEISDGIVNVISFLKEAHIRRSLSGYMYNRPITIFGSKAYTRESESQNLLIGINSISVSFV